MALTLSDPDIGQLSAEFLVLTQACRSTSHARRTETEDSFFPGKQRRKRRSILRSRTPKRKPKGTADCWILSSFAYN